ncbi:MAG: hypothetical protein O2898_06220 [Proteobacteria bacterium]|nr:hypothetical protein [Pseudomonadota bacterium]
MTDGIALPKIGANCSMQVIGLPDKRQSLLAGAGNPGAALV